MNSKQWGDAYKDTFPDGLNRVIIFLYIRPMKYLKSFLLAIAIYYPLINASAQSPNIIPVPETIVVGNGEYHLKGLNVFIESQDRAEYLTEIIKEKIEPATGFELNLVKSSKADIRFIIDTALPEDAYTLTVDRNGATVAASSYGGQFYGLQTILQLLPREIKSPGLVTGVTWNIPYVNIKDSPRFAWRGMLLDVVRHWFTKEEVMKYIDEMSEYKMNIFHWHLTDDQGWRIQIDECPELTEKGAKRASRTGFWGSYEPVSLGESLDYGGFYTKEDIREVVEYAAKRNVSVMPEIDVPGHSLAILYAYPELATFKAPEFINVGNNFYGEVENSLCPGKEETFDLLDKIFREVAEMFPFDYIHIGGDECYREFWEKSPECQTVMARENLKDTAELQSWFIRRMEKILAGYGKKLVGWDEIAEGGLASSATVMSWRGMNGGIAAAKSGHPVIMTPFDWCYLDLYQGEPTAEPNTYSMARLSTCYSLEPVPEGVSPELILGGQGNLWTESVPTFRHAEYMAWPRGWALSEVFWSPKNHRNWEDFMLRVEEHFLRADIADINHADKSVYNAIITPSIDNDGMLNISLSTEIEGLDIRYTIDNTDPDLHSPKYVAPFKLRDHSSLKVQNYRNGAKVGDMIDIRSDILRSQTSDPRDKLREEIKSNPLFARVDSMARAVAMTGFNAGDGYSEVWIRDFNTFIELSMEVRPLSEIIYNFDVFWSFQGPEGDIIDGFAPSDKANTQYRFRQSEAYPMYEAHKNTVETDQESSMVQAVYKYVKKSGDVGYLTRDAQGKKVIDRLEWALGYLYNCKWNDRYGLIIGATTADWGDVQPEHEWGVEIDSNTHYAIDIYDNAMFVEAMDDFISMCEMCDENTRILKWQSLRRDVADNIRKHLWDSERHKFIPHIYLDGSPFPSDFDENAIYYHGGTAIAIEAGLLTKYEIGEANDKMVANVQESGAPTIGLTLYPTYPEGFFKNSGMAPYSYQNGGDWTWFGGRMIQALIANGYTREAYDELLPMLQRVVENNAFHEWYTRDGRAVGSGTFRGEAGVLYKSIEMLRMWAENE